MSTTISDHFEALNLTDAAIADKVGCERSLITKIKLGKARPSPEMAKRIADQTGISLAVLRPDLAIIFGTDTASAA